MGSWGPGLQANDSALDALGILKKEIKQASKNKLPLRELFLKVQSEFGADCDEEILGVADHLLDEEIKGLIEIPEIKKALKSQRKKSVLCCWVNPEERKIALDNFEKRLKGEKVPELDLAIDNAGLFDRMGRSNEELRKTAIKCKEAK